jgi:cytochrome c oxidase subunit 2
MHRWWALLFGVVLFGAFASTAVAPAMGWWLPKPASSYAPDIDNLFLAILFVVAFFYVLTEALLVFNIWRSGQPGRKAEFTHGSNKLEFIWTAVPAVILVALAVIQINVWAGIKYPTRLAESIENGTPCLQIAADARQWEYRFRYPSIERFQAWKTNPKDARADFVRRMPERLEDVHVGNDVHTWKGMKTVLHLRTRDVGHSVFFPNLRLKQDALPGKTIPVWFEPTVANCKKVGAEWKVGYAEGASEYNRDFDFDLLCTQYCGSRHSLMRGKLYVHASEDDFLAWLKHAQAISGSRGNDPAEVAVSP